MWPLAENRPKHLLTVGGKPIIAYPLEALAENSIREVCIVVGYRDEMIRSALGDGGQYGVQIEYLQQPNWTGTATALKMAYRAVGRDPFLVVYGDLWIRPSAVQSVVEKARECPRVIGVVRLRETSDYGVVTLEGDKLTSVSEKPQRLAQEGWVNTGIYAFDQEVFSAIERTPISQRSEFELTSSLQHLVRRGVEIRAAIVGREDWMDVGRPWDLLEANERTLNNLPHRIRGNVRQGAVLKAPVWLEEGATIEPGCSIEGPVYVGKQSRIGPNSRIRPSSTIGNNVHIGTSCEVKNSIVMDGTKIPHLSYVGDSILGESCNLGAGTITANIRFDEHPLTLRVKGKRQNTGRKKLGVIMGDRVQTGINVSILPGIRIGSNSWIGPGAIVSRDLPSNRFLAAKQATVTRSLKRREANLKRAVSR